jgi:hypothetical protein
MCAPAKVPTAAITAAAQSSGSFEAALEELGKVVDPS